MKIIILLTFGIVFSVQFKSFSQGCSDAGFCTIGSLASSTSEDSTLKHLAKLAFSFGIGEQSTTHLHVIPEFEFSFFKNNSIQIKVPYVAVNGNLGSNNGPGDVAFGISQKVSETNKSQFTVTAGTKLPTGNTDQKNGNVSFPMPYQTGLGTFDLILGASYQYIKWKFSLGYQMVLSDKNKNNFVHSAASSDKEIKYFESNLLERGDDALFRIDRNFSLQKIKLSAGLLAIYRVQKDKITDASGKQIALNGSEGLTLNITGGMQYDFSSHSTLSLLFGTPAVVREVRADGLTRKMVLTLGYQFRFGK